MDFVTQEPRPPMRDVQEGFRDAYPKGNGFGVPYAWPSDNDKIKPLVYVTQDFSTTTVPLSWRNTYPVASALQKGEIEVEIDGTNKGKLLGCIRRGLNSAFGPSSNDTDEKSWNRVYNGGGMMGTEFREAYLSEAIAGMVLANATDFGSYRELITDGIIRHPELSPKFSELSREFGLK